jgi:hypothetical protein
MVKDTIEVYLESLHKDGLEPPVSVCAPKFQENCALPRACSSKSVNAKNAFSPRFRDPRSSCRDCFRLETGMRTSVFTNT